MEQNNSTQLHRRKINTIALLIIIIMVGFYTSPLLVNADKSFTLYPKNIPSSWYGWYAGEFMFVKPALKSHRFPLWFPLLEGGRFWIEYPIAIPSFPFVLFPIIFGEIMGSKISWYLFFILGACSMYYLTKGVLRYNISGSVFASLSFSMSGVFVYLFENGFLHCREVLLLPLLVAFFIKAKENYKYVILCSFILSFILIQTALFFPVILLFLFTFTALKSITFENRKLIFDGGYIKTFILLIILTFLFSAVKIFPLVRFLSAHNMVSSLTYADAIHDANTFSLFFARAFIPHNFGPGTMYLGFVPVVLCILATILYFRQTKRLFVMLIFFIILSFGPNIPLDLHRLLWHLPVFRSMAEISKYYSVIIVFVIAVLAGKFFSVFQLLRRKIFNHIISVSLILYVYINLLNANIGYFNVFSERLNYPPAKKDVFHVEALNIHRGDESIFNPLLYFLAKKNIGLMSFADFRFRRETGVIPKYYLLPKYVFLVPATSLFVLPNPSYEGEAFFLNNENIAEVKKFLPNTISVKVHLKSSDRLVINQNFDRYWKSDYGIVENYKGLLSVKLDRAKEAVLHLTYFPKIFFVGLLISLVSVSWGSYILIRCRPT